MKPPPGGESTGQMLPAMTAKDTTRVVSDNSVSHAIEGPVPPRHGKQDRDVQVTSQVMDRLQEVENSAD